MKKFYLIDGHAQLFRAYYAPFRELTSPTGESVKAVHVFTQMILSILRNEQPDYIAVAFDVSDATTHRKSWYPEYKANRDATPEDLRSQFTRVREVLSALNIATFALEGYEADDLIATIAEQLKGEPVELRVASKDKDLHQVLSPTVKLWDPSKGDLLDVKTLLATQGYGPEEAVEIQTLVGDSTDNIPGAYGVGVKTAVRLVGEYGSAQAVVENADALTPKLKENILKHAEQMELTRRLVTLDRFAPMEFELEACVTPTPEMARLDPIFAELGFRSLAGQFAEFVGGAGVKPAREAEPPGTRLHLVTTLTELDELVLKLSKQPAFAVDTETTGLLAVDADVVGYAFSFTPGEGWYVPVRGLHAGEGGDPYLDPAEVARRLKPLLESEDSLKVGQNIKYDINVLKGAGIDLAGPLFDTMIAAALLHPERRTNNMDDLARDLLGVKTTPIKELIGRGKKQKSMLEVPLAEVAAYAAEDADVTWRLYTQLIESLKAADEELQQLFYDVELPLVTVLASMEREGVELDAEALNEYAASLTGRVKDLRESLYEAAGEEFNPDSPKQLGEILFDKLGLPVIKRTKTSRSTDAEVLERLSEETNHPLPQLLLEYRELSKLLGTYVEPLPSYLARSTGRLHASFHQTGAATGRLSSSDPNIQNIPVRTAAGREIRRAFRASAGKSLVMADYSQVELRMLAHFSQDEQLVKAFREGLDIHSFVASELFGVPLGEVDREQRNVAKTVNFGIIYGQSAFGLARTLNISQGEAARFIGAYKERYQGLERFLAQCVNEALESGHVTTILGRRRAINEIRSRNRNLRLLGERLAINTVIQGSAADLIKVAMVRLNERLSREESEARLLIQVHDELVLETPAETATAVMETAVAVMTSALPLDVPLRVDAAVAQDWLGG